MISNYQRLKSAVNSVHQIADRVVGKFSGSEHELLRRALKKGVIDSSEYDDFERYIQYRNIGEHSVAETGISIGEKDCSKAEKIAGKISGNF
jgi:uncharacterized protein YutE (UPF0331/DUF86 family)